jgi:hypothetical protein
MRSISGFSGSQVIVYYPAHGKPTTDVSEDPLYIHNSREVMGNAWLLGVDWGHLWASEDVYDAQDKKIERMRVNVGMSGVVPALEDRRAVASTMRRRRAGGSGRGA